MSETTEEIAEANSRLAQIIDNPTVQVDVCGQFPEDTSTVQNFEQISEGQRLYSKKKLREAYRKWKEEERSKQEKEERLGSE